MTTPTEATPDALTDVENSVMSVVSVEEVPTEETPVVEAALEDEPLDLPDAEDVQNTGAMVALIPSQGNIDRLAVEEGEHPDQLHCTVVYLGEAADIPDDVFAAVMEEIVGAIEEAEEPGPVVAEGFNVSLFNPHREDRDTCVVLGLSGEHLSLLAQRIRARILDRLAQMSHEIPTQHEPWIPHVTLQYTDDHSSVERFADRTGDITFDRVRVALGDDIYDIDLDETSRAPAEVAEDMDMSANTTDEVFASTEGTDVDDGEIVEETVAATPDEPGAWSGILVVEDVESGDGRMFSGGSLKTAPLPLPLMWQRQTDEGHKTAVQAGRIDDVWRDGNKIWGSGVFDLEGPDGLEAFRQVKAKFLRGVSVDVDSVKNSDIEMIFPKMTGEEDDFEKLFSAPDVTVFHHGRLRGATLVQFPAFVEASIALTGEDIVTDVDTLEASGEQVPIRERSTEVLTASGPEDQEPDDSEIPDAALTIQPPACDHNTEGLTACACQEEEAPDPAYFVRPEMDGPTALTIDGRHVYGHAALRGTCHTGFAGQCVTMPVEGSHDYFLLGETLCADGSTVATGTITLGTGHAGTDGKVTPFDAIKHYDHTGTVVADITTGEDEFGLWFSGALRTDIPVTKVRSLRAAKLSGDWRKFGNKLRLVALLAVNVPGFPVPRMRTAVHNGRQVALVAAGINPSDVRVQEKQKTQESFRTVLSSLATRIGRDPHTRMSELKSQVHGR